MEVRHARHARHTRRRSTARTPLVLVGLLVVFLGLVVLPAGKVNRSASASVGRSGLLDASPDLLVQDCRVPFDGSANVHFPVNSFDVDQLVHVTVSDSEGWASGGGTLFPTVSTVVRVHVPAGSVDGDHPVAVSATGTRRGTPAALHATLTVRVRCSGR